MQEKFVLTSETLRVAEEMEPIAETVYQAVKEIETMQLQMVPGTVIDRWGAYHRLSRKEIYSVLEELAAVQKRVFEAVGDYIEEVPGTQET